MDKETLDKIDKWVNDNMFYTEGYPLLSVHALSNFLETLVVNNNQIK